MEIISRIKSIPVSPKSGTDTGKTADLEEFGVFESLLKILCKNRLQYNKFR
jgi:hypothetical protein